GPAGSCPDPRVDAVVDLAYRASTTSGGPSPRARRVFRRKSAAWASVHCAKVRPGASSVTPPGRVRVRLAPMGRARVQRGPTPEEEHGVLLVRRPAPGRHRRLRRAPRLPVAAAVPRHHRGRLPLEARGRGRAGRARRLRRRGAVLRPLLPAAVGAGGHRVAGPGVVRRFPLPPRPPRPRRTAPLVTAAP